MSYKTDAENWEKLAADDALWAILTRPGKSGNQWEVEEFFRTGYAEVEWILDHVRSRHLLDDFTTALDIGCGVGRLSRPLAERFERVIGVDVSGTMIAKARQLNAHLLDRIDFVRSFTPGLEFIEPRSVSLVYCSIVLQHIPPHAGMQIIRGFLGTLRPGGLAVFQLPVRDIRPLTLSQRVRQAVRLRTRLRELGLGRNLAPQMRMYVYDDRKILDIIQAAGAVLADQRFTNQTDPASGGNVAFIDEGSSVDYVSRMYFARRSQANP